MKLNKNLFIRIIGLFMALSTCASAQQDFSQPISQLCKIGYAIDDARDSANAGRLEKIYWTAVNEDCGTIQRKGGLSGIFDKFVLGEKVYTTNNGITVVDKLKSEKVEVIVPHELGNETTAVMKSETAQ